MPNIHWPEHFKPENCAVHVVNQLEIDASPAAVWDCLINASAWPEWYPNAANVRVHGTKDGRLFEGAKFRWKTFGVTIETQVQEFIPHTRIAWSAKSFGLEVYHAWLITPKGAGCTVLTEETQNGFLARLGHFLRPGQMHKFHQIWLEYLRDRAKALVR